MMVPWRRLLMLHLGVLALLLAAQFFLPAYHHTNVARIMVLATFAIGYNVLLGYTGLMSLGHAMFFAVGMYATGLSVYYWGWSGPLAFLAGIGAGIAASAVLGAVILRTAGVSFLIVTMMFSQSVYLLILYFNPVTYGDQGFSISAQLAPLSIFGQTFEWSNASVKYNAAWLVCAVGLLISLMVAVSPFGRVLHAIKQNEPRAQLLGYDTYRYRLLAMIVSGTIAAASGAAYALLFSYVGASFASILYSIYPLLWTLVGGAGTVLGPLLGTGVMFYLVDLASDWTSSYLIVVGAVLIALVLWFPLGVLGTIRERWVRWLP